MKQKQGFTLVELLVVIGIIALLIGLLLPALAKARKNANSLKDKTQIQQVHKAGLGYAGENKGLMPTPGLIDRLPDPMLNNQNQIGQGPEDHTQNTTARLYSAMIAQNLFHPKICLGTTEVNLRIREDKDYNFNAYQPVLDNYWDENFKGDPSVSGANDECNTSYAHMALVGNRKKLHWRDVQSATVAAFGTRGTGGSYAAVGGTAQPNGGAISGPQYEKSPTLLLHGPPQQWVGHVCFMDNHAETLNSFFAPSVSYLAYQGGPPNMRKDNIYAAEFLDIPAPAGATHQTAGDSWLAMFNAVNVNGLTCTPVWDPLLQ